MSEDANIKIAAGKEIDIIIRDLKKIENKLSRTKQTLKSDAIIEKSHLQLLNTLSMLKKARAILINAR